MLATTKQAIAATVTAILAADPSVTKEHRTAIIAAATSQTDKPASAIPRVIRREEAARILGFSAKRCDQLASIGALKRVTVPGMTRSIGFTEQSVRAISEGSAA
jgi:hypothetical protein